MNKPITIETILGVSVDITKIMKFCGVKESELLQQKIVKHISEIKKDKNV